MSGILCKPDNRGEMWLTHHEVRSLFQVAFCSTERGPALTQWRNGAPVDVGASRLLRREPGCHHGAKARGRLMGPLDDVQYWRDLINDHLGPTVP